MKKVFCVTLVFVFVGARWSQATTAVVSYKQNIYGAGLSATV